MIHPLSPRAPTVIARELCLIDVKLSGLPNSEQGTLQEVAVHLSTEPPDLDAARQALAEGMAHAFRFEWRERLPEAWLVAACTRLLKDA